IVIFSGTMPLQELRHERPLEYERLQREGRLDAMTVKGQPAFLTDLGILFGFCLVIIGMLLLVLIILGQFFS
ncbi:MAG TPA: cytochrome C, partial [Nitrospirota bacterium]|nr:cytochrome C [Nitrospirota bacterium]